MANSEVTISGLKELDELLKTLPAVIVGNIMRAAMRAGQKVIVAAAKENLVSHGNVRTGDLQRSIKVVFNRKNEERYGWMRAKIIAGNKKAWYAHLIEFGSGSFYAGKGESVGGPYVIQSKKGKALLMPKGGDPVYRVIHPGIHPQPFMRPAFDAKAMAAIETFAEYVRKRLPQELKKASK